MRFLLPLCLALAACSSDPAPPVDSGPADTGPLQVDIGSLSDAPLDVAAQDRPDPTDSGTDLGAADTGVDAVTKDWPLEDRPDAAAADTGSDVPIDARVNCQATVSVACRTSAECAATCLPHTSTDVVRWCCIGGGELGECGGSLNPACARP